MDSIDFEEEEVEALRDEISRNDLIEAEENKRCWAKVLSTYEGRYVIHQIVEGMAKQRSSSFAGEQTHKTAFREGQRSIGEIILRDGFTNRGETYILMLSEAEKRAQSKKLRTMKIVEKMRGQQDAT
tara:strand:+ start:1738 stop:2118 length:381 start_codon:yes stop_codon:yes gene_type:complete